MAARLMLTRKANADLGDRTNIPVIILKKVNGEKVGVMM